MRSDSAGRSLAHAGSLGILARGLALVPLVPILLAFTLPVAVLDFQDLDKPDPRMLTWPGLVGQFGEMRSAFGVQPVVVVSIVGLLGMFVGCCAAAVQQPVPLAARNMLSAWPRTLVQVCAVVIILAALPFPFFLDSADHVDQEIHAPPFRIHGQGWAFTVLAAVMALVLVRLVSEVDDATTD